MSEIVHKILNNGHLLYATQDDTTQVDATILALQ